MNFSFAVYRAISVILGDKWKSMKQEDRREYVIQAKLLADEHKRVNPDCWKRKRNSEVSVQIIFAAGSRDISCNIEVLAVG